MKFIKLILSNLSNTKIKLNFVLIMFMYKKSYLFENIFSTIL